MRIECPLCGRVLPEVPEDYPPRPFCSARCKLVDLDNWLKEAYRIPLEGSAGSGGSGDGHAH